MRGRSRSRRQLCCAATIWLLSANFVYAQDHPNSRGHQITLTSPTTAALASASDVSLLTDDERRVAISSPNGQESQTFEIGLDDGHPLGSAGGAPAKEQFPSPRCVGREEWQGECTIWSGKPHHRYLEFNNMPSREGIGASLTRVAWALSRAISSDLEPVINGPLHAGHGTGDFGDWMGLTHNPYLAIQDPVEFGLAVTQTVPFPEGNGDAWFLERENRTSVIYVPNTMKAAKAVLWGIPVSPPNSDPGVCGYVRQALRNFFWSVPQNRGRCRGLLPDDHRTPPESEVLGATGGPHAGKRPWVVAVHVRRGDTIHYRNGIRSLSHTYFQATVLSVLSGIATADPGAHVSVLVFSEGPKTLEELQLIDENDNVVTWDIERESCLGLELVCSQKIHLKTSAFETFDCMAAADVIVASRSAFSESAAAVSTNIKVMLRKNQTEQDRVVLDPEATSLNAVVSADEQVRMDTAIADWWYCSGEARQSTGTDGTSLAARRFYQTVDEV